MRPSLHQSSTQRRLRADMSMTSYVDLAILSDKTVLQPRPSKQHPALNNQTIEENVHIARTVEGPRLDGGTCLPEQPVSAYVPVHSECRQDDSSRYSYYHSSQMSRINHNYCTNIVTLEEVLNRCCCSWIPITLIVRPKEIPRHQCL